MSAARSTFRKTDIKRLLEAASSAGVKVKGVEVDKNGKMLLVVDDGEAAPKPQDSLDTWMATRADSA
jgi:hypothetical protein